MSDVKVSDRGSRSVVGRGETLSLDDCRCPVCLEIFMEPVTLPCTHTFCKDCFLESVDKATMCCPLCRKRVSTWARLNNRNNTLVDQQLWTQIQRCFPLQCERRLSGQDAGTEDNLEVSVCFPRVCQPGELKQEYEDQVTKLKEEKRVLDEEERRASEEYIQRLLAEEEALLQEERRGREEDERLARQLSTQLNSSPVSQNSRPSIVIPSKKKKEVIGQIDRFLCPLPPVSNSSSFMANKENILVSQVTLQVTGGGAPTTAKRKSSELETSEDKEVVDPKRGCLSSTTTLSSSSSVDVWEVELLSRQRQEEEDRQLALLLQKELDHEEKQRATDRSKGSSDPYLLRRNSRGKVETSSSSRPSRASRSTTKTSSTTSPSSSSTTSPSSSSSSSSSSSTTTSYSSSPSNRKQVTLTDMFSSLSSSLSTVEPEMS